VDASAYRRSAEDEAIAPLSVDLLVSVISAIDEGRDPYATEIATPGGRPKLAIAFTVSAVLSVLDRRRPIVFVGAICGLLILGEFVVKGYAWFALSLFRLAAVIALGVFIGLYVRAMRALRALAASAASPTVVAAELRRIADWPAAKDDPLSGWPPRQP
jgi:hypothetical protein